jgi:PAS domain S-box-containing protein
MQRWAQWFQWFSLALVIAAPGLVAGYLFAFQRPPLVYRNFLFHEFVVAIALVLGGFISFVSYRCYRRSGERILFFLTLAFLTFTVVYAPHGFLTRTAVDHPPLFLLFGPVSRLGMAIFFLLAMHQFDRPPDPEPLRGKTARWLPWAGVPVALILFEPFHAYGTGSLLHPVRFGIELTSVLLFALGLVPLYRSYRRSALFPHLLLAIFLSIESCLVFLVARPFEHLWWYAHVLFAAGFVVLGYGIILVYRSSGSFSEVFIDVEAMEQLTRQRKQSLHAFAQLADSLPVLILEWREEQPGTQQVTFLNRHARELFELDSSNIPDLALPSLLERTMDSAEQRQVRQLFRSDDVESVRDAELRFSVADGESRWVHLTVSVATDWEGRPVWRAIGLDITGLKQSQERQLQAERRLAQVGRYQALSQLTGGLAHEINNMLQPLALSLELASLELEDKEPDRENLDAAIRAADRIRELIERAMRVHSELDSDEFRRTPVYGVISEVLGTLRQTTPKTVTLENRLQRTDKCWPIARVEVFQVITNIVTNALHALPPSGGAILIEGEGSTREGVEGYAVRIRDSGHGIDPSNLERVFDPFFTTKQVGQGTGLGLPVARQAIEAGGGEITVTSEIGRGTTVEFWLPIVADEDS